MLTRLLESVLVTIFNAARRGWARRRASQPVPTEPEPDVPADYAVLGHVLPAPTGAEDERITRRLSDRGIVALSPAARMQHVYILGATGSGKTNLLLRLIESDIRNRRALCVVDLRGDLIDRILPRLAAAAPTEEWRERLLLLDLRENDHLVGFNPLQGDGDVYSRAMHLLGVIKAQSDSWGVQLEETLRNCLIALAETGWSLMEVEPLLMDARFRAEVLAGVSDSGVRGFFDRYESNTPARQSDWSLAVLNKITPLLSVPQLRLVLGQRQPLPFRSLIENQPGLVILVSLAVDRLHDAGRLLGGLFVSSFQSAIMARADQPEHQRVPVHLYVDEFETMASDRFASIVAEGRRFGLGLTLSHQNISQLQPGLRNVLRNNVRTQVYFQTGALDAAELAREIPADDTRDSIRTALMSQSVGQAFLVRRGEASQRVQVLHCPDPPVAGDAVARLRMGSLETYARPRSEIERELAERFSRAGPFLTPTQGHPPAAPIIEIRHDKLDRFAPVPGQKHHDRDTDG